MIGHHARFRENDDLPLWRGPAAKKMPPFFNAPALIMRKLCAVGMRNAILGNNLLRNTAGTIITASNDYELTRTTSRCIRSNAVLHLSRTQFNQLGSCEVRRLTQLSSTDFIWSSGGVLHAWPAVYNT